MRRALPIATAIALTIVNTHAPAPVRAAAAPPVAPSSARSTRAPWRAAARPPGNHRPLVVDPGRRLDVNELGMQVSNYGLVASDAIVGTPGLVYPRDQGTGAMESAGLWLGALVQGSARVSIAENGKDWAPGAILPGGILASPQDSANHVYKMVRWTGDPRDSAHVERTAAEMTADPAADPIVHHSWSEYLAGAAPYGAPVRRYRLPNTHTPDPGDSIDVLGPEVSGDQMLWSVYNDGNPASHRPENEGGTAPLAVQVRQTVFAFDRPGPLARTAFVRIQVANRGPATLVDLCAALWASPEIGDPNDDLAGCDSSRGLAFAYNGGPHDAVAGNRPPAVGVGLLAGPGAGPRLHAFARWTQDQDPDLPQDLYGLMLGQSAGGTPLTDPVTGVATRFACAGDPVRGAGWLDALPGSRQLLATAAPVTLAPGDSTTLVFAIEVSPGADFLGSLGSLRCDDAFVREQFASGFPPATPPAAGDCESPSNCPRAASWWQRELAAPSHLDRDALARLARAVSAAAGTFGWPEGTEFESLRATITPRLPTDARADARREFAALLANVMAGRLGLAQHDGAGIWLNPLTPSTCGPVGAGAVGALVERVDPTRRLVAADYLTVDPKQPAPLAGVALGLGLFDDGAGVAARMSMSAAALDTVAQRDSFTTVEIRFDRAHPSRAYRFLRLEVEGTGAAPPQGRAWLFGGYRDVPFQVWDADRRVELACAFTERVLTDAAGTILRGVDQPATDDSTWAPDTTALGGHEFLFVLRRAYAPTPDPAIAHDGALAGPALGAMYALGARRVSESIPITDGDRFRFEWGRDALPSMDAELLDLAGRALTDAGVAARYAALASCAQQLNQGIGVGAVCASVTATLTTLLESDAEPGRVRLAWYAGGMPFTAELRRAVTGGPWLPVASAAPDGTGRLSFEDRAVEAGHRYGYRLVRAATGAVLDEIWLTVPGAPRLALAGLRPNPVTPRDAAVAFTLPTPAPANLDVFDIAGRRVATRVLRDFAPGNHVLPLPELGRLPAGVYTLRLSQSRVSATARAVLVP